MKENQKEKKFIDLREVINKKNPRLLKVLPKFVLNFVRQIIHEEDMNSFIVKHGHKKDLEFVDAVLEEFGVKLRVVGGENIPETGGCIIAGNHPLGGIDGLALLKVIGEHRSQKDIKFIVNDILLNLENIKALFIPVNKHGKNSAEIMDRLDRAYASDEAILIFPAGLVSRKQEKGIMDLTWKKSFVAQARKHQRNIIPFFVEGKNSKRFYELAHWRKKFNIKANLEMFFLVDEMYRQKNKTITLIFGEPIDYTLLDSSHTDIIWSERIKKHVYQMGQEGKSIAFNPSSLNEK